MLWSDEEKLAGEDADVEFGDGGEGDAGFELFARDDVDGLVGEVELADFAETFLE